MKLFDSPRKIAIWLVSIFIVITCYMLIMDRFAPNTNYAYVIAYTLKVAPQVSGKITQLAVRDDQKVKKGQLLFVLDKTPYKAKLMKAKASYSLAEIKFNQYQKLYKTKAVSLDQYLAAKDKQQSAEAALDLAKFDFNHTNIYAPSAGYVTNLKTNLGSYAKVGQAVMTFVANNKWWVVANFKENNLSRIKLGQRALISINLYPGNIIHAKVGGVGWGVLPTDVENSVGSLPKIKKTNNWVRLAQRFPVRFYIKDNIDGKPLRVGATAIVTVYTADNWLLKTLAYVGQWFRTRVQYLY